MWEAALEPDTEFGGIGMRRAAAEARQGGAWRAWGLPAGGPEGLG